MTNLPCTCPADLLEYEGRHQPDCPRYGPDDFGSCEHYDDATLAEKLYPPTGKPRAFGEISDEDYQTFHRAFHGGQGRTDGEVVAQGATMLVWFVLFLTFCAGAVAGVVIW